MKIISKLLNIAEITIKESLPANYKADMVDFKEGTNEQKLRLLCIYAWLVADEIDCIATLGTPFVSGLKDEIPKYLHFKEWTAFIDGIIYYKNLAECNTFDDAVPEGYRKLIEVFYPSPKFKVKGKDLLDEILVMMHKEEIPFPTEEDVNRIEKFLEPYLLKKLETKEDDQLHERQIFVPLRQTRHFDKVFVDEIKEIAHEAFPVRTIECFESFFGISSMTIGEVGDKYDLTVERVKQLKDKAVSRIFNRIHQRYPYLIDANSADYIPLAKKLSEISGKLEIEINNHAKYEIDAVQSINMLRSNIVTLSKYIHSIRIEKEIRKEIQFGGEKVLTIINEDFSDFIQSIEEYTDLELLKKLRIPVEDLEFSVRAYNCLKAAKINNLGDLVQYTFDELTKFRNFGQKSLSEIEQVLHERGLQPGMKVRFEWNTYQ